MESNKAEVQTTDFQPWGMDVKQFTILMHLSQFAGYVVPFAGFVLPIIMWTSFKDKNSVIDEHGKKIINFMISFIIYASVAIVLCFFLIGIPLLFVLGVLGVLFPILGSIKANENQIYKYPLAISFL